MNRWEDTDSDSIVAADTNAGADDIANHGKASIRKDTEDAAAYAAEYSDADAQT